MLFFEFYEVFKNTSGRLLLIVQIIISKIAFYLWLLSFANDLAKKLPEKIASLLTLGLWNLKFESQSQLCNKLVQAFEK